MKALLAALVFVWPVGLQAQEHHQRHHTFYQNWVNQQGTGCCNN